MSSFCEVHALRPCGAPALAYQMEGNARDRTEWSYCIHIIAKCQYFCPYKWLDFFRISLLIM